MTRYVLSLDQGTTSSRAILFADDGGPVAVAQQEFPQIYPKPGWVEHNPEDIWSTQLAVAREALTKAGAVARDVAAIGVTNQRETTIIWDRKTGEPVCNAIVWQCRRTAPMCDALKAGGFDQVLREKTGLVTDAYFSGTKVAWILENVPSARERAERGELAFGTVDTFLLWRLSGGRLHVTDVSNASRTLLFNIRLLDWDDEILAHLKIPRSLLPELRASSAVYGESDPAIFGAAIPLAGDAGDQQAATFGQACFAPGMAKNTYGTGCFMLLNTGERPVESNSGLLTTVGWRAPSPDTGQPAAVQWLRDGLGIIPSSAGVEALAGSVADNGGVYFVPAFVGLGAPYWDPYARGTIVGLTRGATAAHVARAALESIAYQTRDVLEAMERDAGLKLQTLRVDGGAAVNDLLMQFQADILGVPVQRPKVSETTALGAAYLAGLAVGFLKSQDEIAGQWALDREYEPTMNAA
ncbi:MAG: glycerol kinase GlpK, partial [Chloroflexi bacterium]|nr:glycerol kinase GlpK [Chloroflexota bacterium]